MRRTLPTRAFLIVVAATAGCQTTGTHPTEVPRDDLAVTRTFTAGFDAVVTAMQNVLKDHDAMRDIAGLDYTKGVETRWRGWKTPFRKVATRTMENGDRTITVKVEQQAKECLVSVRVLIGTVDDRERSAALLAQIGESIAPAETSGRESSSAPAPDRFSRHINSPRPSDEPPTGTTR